MEDMVMINGDDSNGGDKMNFRKKMWELIKAFHTNEKGGTGTPVSTDEDAVASKINLKLETVDASDITAGAAIAAIPMKFQTFICPAPGTDWTPQLEGVKLAADKSAKKFWIPLSGLKVGDIITTYNIVGDVVKVAEDTVTFDCKIVRVNKADSLTTTDLTNGAITQVTADGNFDSTANVDDETVATDKAYVLECLGTTSNVSATEQIIVTHAEITVTRLLKPA